MSNNIRQITEIDELKLEVRRLGNLGYKRKDIIATLKLTGKQCDYASRYTRKISLEEERVLKKHRAGDITRVQVAKLLGIRDTNAGLLIWAYDIDCKLRSNPNFKYEAKDKSTHDTKQKSSKSIYVKFLELYNNKCPYYIICKTLDLNAEGYVTLARRMYDMEDSGDTVLNVIKDKPNTDDVSATNEERISYVCYFNAFPDHMLVNKFDNKIAINGYKYVDTVDPTGESIAYGVLAGLNADEIGHETGIGVNVVRNRMAKIPRFFIEYLLSNKIYRYNIIPDIRRTFCNIPISTIYRWISAYNQMIDTVRFADKEGIKLVYSDKLERLVTATAETNTTTTESLSLTQQQIEFLDELLPSNYDIQTLITVTRLDEDSITKYIIHNKERYKDEGLDLSRFLSVKDVDDAYEENRIISEGRI